MEENESSQNSAASTSISPVGTNAQKDINHDIVQLKEILLDCVQQASLATLGPIQFNIRPVLTLSESEGASNAFEQLLVSFSSDNRDYVWQLLLSSRVMLEALKRHFQIFPNPKISKETFRDRTKLENLTKQFWDGWAKNVVSHMQFSQLPGVSHIKNLELIWLPKNKIWKPTLDRNIERQSIFRTESSFGNFEMTWYEFTEAPAKGNSENNTDSQKPIATAKLQKVISLQGKQIKLGANPPGFFPFKLTEALIEKELPHDLYLFLPLNQKMLLYRNKNSMIEASAAFKFMQLSFQGFYISLEEHHDVIRQKAKNIASTFADKKVPRSVRISMVQEKTAEIVTTAFSNPSQFISQNLEQLRELNSEVISHLSKNPDFFNELLKNLSKNKADVAQALNCQSLALLFGLGLGYSQDKALADLAMASLLHDVGMSFISPESRASARNNLSAELLKEYQSHCSKTVEWINQIKPALVSRETILMIEQHHENVDGSGFPRGLRSVNIYPLSKLLRIVDELVYQLNLRQFENPAADLLKILEELIDSNKNDLAYKYDKRFLNDMLLFMYKCFPKAEKSAA